ncbi:malto-oligosyltrehalose trehalohydrolase [Micrococcus sp. FDAARGOS_333]|uniref:malto-oligosyltrehalose trehalohydrolase n=1 Tax=Micrococcus sp. FDAARGOS_333 TaxID=1930558 RepID=UPI001D1225CC|nr:malto-oligosyltrehalose trehalohydrolase [Micrococcus sp. FDAARGOS_333]
MTDRSVTGPMAPAEQTPYNDAAVTGGAAWSRLDGARLDPGAQAKAAADAAREVPYAVWAPHAETVEIVLVDTEPGELHDAEDRWPVSAAVRMERAGGGWWTPAADVEEAAGRANPGYGYRVDRSAPVPDPRSRRQPDTVHGPSRRDVEAADFAWTDAGWAGPDGVERDPSAPQGGGLRGAVLYELHVGTFTAEGTLDAAIGHLDELAELGVTHVELLPVNSFGGEHNWGYDGVGWYAVDESYGGPEAYRRFVDAAHARGLGVVQDVVYNHLGPSGNYLGVFGPYLSAGTGWGEGPNLDGPDSDEVRRFILDNVTLWLKDMHVDGLRLDAVHALRDTRAVHLLEEMAAHADALAAQLGRPLPLIAESDLNDASLITPRAAGGLGLAGQWNDDVHHAIHVATTGETHGYYADFAADGALAKTVEAGFFHDGTFSSFRGRDHGRPVAEDVPNHAFVSSIQNHDQVGNRAAGDRTAAALSEGALAAAAALLLTGPATPMLFMGEEFASSAPFPFFTAHREPELAEAVRTGRRREFAAHGWDEAAVPDPQQTATRDSAVLDRAEAVAGRGARIRGTYRELIRLRRTVPQLTEPRRAATAVQSAAEQRWVRWDRRTAGGGDGSVVVLLAALGEEPMPLPEDLVGVELLAGHDDDGPLTAVPDVLPAPGFLLLQRG